MSAPTATFLQLLARRTVPSALEAGRGGSCCRSVLSATGPANAAASASSWGRSRGFHGSAHASSSKGVKQRPDTHDRLRYSNYPSWPVSAPPPKILDDGSVFITRTPTPREPVTADKLPPAINPISSPFASNGVTFTDATPVRTTQNRRLTDAEVAEMRRLRKEDPHVWTIRKLAKRFNCVRGFVAMNTVTPPERVALVNAEAEHQWIHQFGLRKRLAVINRLRRRELW